MSKKGSSRGITLNDLSPAHRAQALAQIEPSPKVICQRKLIRAEELVKTSKPSPRVKNKWESKYAEYLEIMRRTGEISAWRFEPIRLRLANSAWFKPDFLVVARNEDKDCDVFQFHEVKGFWREAAKVRIKVAAELFPFFDFIVVKWKDGNWEKERLW